MLPLYSKLYSLYNGHKFLHVKTCVLLLVNFLTSFHLLFHSYGSRYWALYLNFSTILWQFLTPFFILVFLLRTYYFQTHQISQLFIMLFFISLDTIWTSQNRVFLGGSVFLGIVDLDSYNCPWWILVDKYLSSEKLFALHWVKKHI